MRKLSPLISYIYKLLLPKNVRKLPKNVRKLPKNVRELPKNVREL
jgi:hypothetical protein